MRNLSIFIHFIRKYSSNANTMKFLNVAEKNDAAKTIAGLLSNGSARRREGLSVYNKIYDFDSTVRGKNCKMIMTSVSGHMLDYQFLTSYKGWHTCDPQQLFDAPIKKSVTEHSEKIKRTIEREIKGCQGLIVWTDCDREGENIGFEVINVCKAIRPSIQIYRAKFSEITTNSVRRALANLAQPDARQNSAVDVRQEIDLRTGAALTRFQTLRFQRMFPQNIADKLISYGSCQIPTLGFVAERYKEIEAFVSEPFWKIKVIHTIEDLTVEFNWERNRLFNKDACEDYLMLCLVDPKATVENVSVKPKNKWRPNPMDTVALEKLGSRKLKINAKETMSIAEKLYTQGLISYPRTETNLFSPDIDLKSLVELQTPHSDYGSFANRVLEWGPNPRNGSKSDQAHPPIHPTKFTTGLNGNEARIYELIVRHFLACVSKDATGSETIVNINIAGEKFHANGLVIFERNYLDVYPYEKWNAKQIHRYEIGQIFEPTEISMQEGATTAPPLLTEADLITLMEKHGIGTDATHADHIHKIKERGYIGEVDRGFLVPGTIGMGLYEGYCAMDLALAKPFLRAEFETDLKKICNGEKDPKVVLAEQIVKYKEAYQIITQRITSLDEKIGIRLNETPNNNNSSENNSSNQQRIQEVFKCPKCDISHMAIKSKKNNTGFFIGCLNFPDCKNVVWLSDAIKDVKMSESFCENCGNESRQIDFKFKQNSYLGLLNASSSTYTTCLLCDSDFRTLFDINVDQVKNSGPIVDDLFLHTNNNRNIIPSNPRNINPNTNANSNSSIFLNSGTSRAPRSTNNRNNNRKKTPKNSRSYSTTTTLPQQFENNLQSNEISTNANNLDDLILLDDEWDVEFTTSAAETATTDLLDDDDGFDNLLGNADFSEPITWGTSQNSHNRNSTNFQNGTDESIPWGTGQNSNNRNNLSERANVRQNRNSTNIPNEPNESWGTRQNSQNRNSTNIQNGTDESIPWGTGQNSNNRNNVPERSNLPQNVSSSWGTSTNLNSTIELPNIRHNINLSSNSNWGTSSERNVAQTRNNSGMGTSTDWRANENNFNSRQSEIPTNNHQTDDDGVNCTVCGQPARKLNVRKEGPNNGRPFYSCANQCSFFQWADESQRINQNNQPAPAPAPPQQQQRNLPINDDGNSPSNVRCSGCNQPAKSLTVRKEGPNQGRPFYVCPNGQSCNFFKWGDENLNPNEGPSTSSWGSNNSRNNAGSSSRGASRSNRGSRQSDPKKRKCGLCRNEGHTKTKCPRRAEFDN